VSCSKSIEQSQLAMQSAQHKLAELQKQIGELLEKHYQGHPHLLQLTK